MIRFKTIHATMLFTKRNQYFQYFNIDTNAYR